MRNFVKITIFFWLATVVVVHAGPPFATDDTETPPAGGWEINVPFTLEREHRHWKLEAPLLDLNYGAVEDVQLKLEVPSKVVHDEGGVTQVGPGDMHFGVKWRFLNDEKSGFQLAIYPQALLPTGDATRGLGSGQYGCVLPLLIQKEWNKWTVFSNVGYVLQTGAGRKNYIYAGAALLREINPHLTLGAEFSGDSPRDEDGRSSLAFNVGGIWKLNRHLNFLLSAGHSIRGSDNLTAYLGLQFLTK